MLRTLLLVLHGATVLGEPCVRPDDCSSAGDVCVHPSGGVVPSDGYVAEDCTGADGGPAICDCHQSDGAAYACTSGEDQCQKGLACALGECVMSSAQPWRPSAGPSLGRRVLVVTQPRSGSEALMQLLAQHPGVHYLGEALNPDEDHARRLKARFGLTRGDVQRNSADAVERVLASCSAPVCALKLFASHLSSPAAARRLVDGVPHGSIHLVALERTNVEAEFASYKAALESGVWDGTPMLQEARRAMVKEGGSSKGLKSPELANKTSFADFKREHDAWFEEIAALRSLAPVLWLKSEDFFHAPEEEAQRVFDFLGVERANVSIKRYEDEALNGILRGQKYLNGRRTVAGAPPSAAPPPPPFPPLRPGVTFGVKHTSGFAGRQLQFCRLLESIREVYPEESSPILVAYDGEETYEAGREPCTGVGVTYLSLERRGLSAARNAIIARAFSPEVVTLAGHARSVACVAAAPDGRVVTGSDDGTLMVVGVWRDGMCERTIRAYRDIALAVLPGGARLVSVSNDRHAKL